VSGMRHVYSTSPSSPFHIPLRGRLPIPSQVVNHHHYNHNHHHYRSHQYHASSDQLSQVEPDHTHSSKNKHTDQADQKILKQVKFSCPIYISMPISLLFILIPCSKFQLIHERGLIGIIECTIIYFLSVYSSKKFSPKIPLVTRQKRKP
jgi:hypothetical protein